MARILILCDALATRRLPSEKASPEVIPMSESTARRAHLITGGFPPGSSAGHDQDYARLRLLGLLAEQDVPASVANDFADVEKWLPLGRLLITYVAGPYPDAAQCRAIEAWLEAGGRWLGLHGVSGGRAERVEGSRQRRTVKTEHHALLGSYFLTHPPICKIKVDVAAGDHPLTRGLGTSFVVEDEPYFIELQHPASTRVLLTADYGPGATSPTIGTLYAKDTSLQPDGRTRVLGYTRDVGQGGVTYVALGHCHNPAIRASRTQDPTDTTPLTFRGSWETDAFTTLLKNAIAWGVRTA
jgi:type 1 glutamine amidotransferase